MAKAKKKRQIKPDLDQYITERNERHYMTYAKAAMFYSMPYYAFVRLAKEADACWQVRRTVVVDLDKVDKYLEQYREGEHKDGL